MLNIPRRRALQLIGATGLAVVGGTGFASAAELSFPLVTPPNLHPEAETDADGLAEIRSEPDRFEMRINAEDLALIADANDPERLNGFYEVVLFQETATGAVKEVDLPGFQGFIAAPVEPGQANPFEPTIGELDFRADLNGTDLNDGEVPFDASGTLKIYNVAVERDLVTGEAIEGPNGEPFVIAQRNYVALQGQTTTDQNETLVAITRAECDGGEIRVEGSANAADSVSVYDVTAAGRKELGSAAVADGEYRFEEAGLASCPGTVRVEAPDGTFAERDVE